MKLACLLVPIAVLFQTGAVSACPTSDGCLKPDEPAVLHTPGVEDQDIRTRGASVDVSATQRERVSELILMGRLAEALKAMLPLLAAPASKSTKVACEGAGCSVTPEVSSDIAAKGSSIQVAIADQERVTYRGTPPAGVSASEREAVVRLVRDNKLSEAYARLTALLPQN